mmetsp:Transcript_4096/g.12440  ORF Transcript_4096/g.12440 Transcript_4096/m.12440 type:complete len:228 (+) Transcript_4096:84-767(+)
MLPASLCVAPAGRSSAHIALSREPPFREWRMPAAARHLAVRWQAVASSARRSAPSRLAGGGSSGGRGRGQAEEVRRALCERLGLPQRPLRHLLQCGGRRRGLQLPERRQGPGRRLLEQRRHGRGGMRACLLRHRQSGGLPTPQWQLHGRHCREHGAIKGECRRRGARARQRRRRRRRRRRRLRRVSALAECIRRRRHRGGERVGGGGIGGANVRRRPGVRDFVPGLV